MGYNTLVLVFPRKIMGKNIDHTDTPTNTQVLTFESASDKWVASDAGGDAFAVVVKPTDETRNSTAVSALDTALQLTLPIGIYHIEWLLGINSAVTPDLKWRGMVSTGTMTGTVNIAAWDSTNQVTTVALDVDEIVATNAAINHLMITCLVTVTAAGVFGLGWAQNTSNAGDTTIKAGSIMKVFQA